MGQNGKRIFDCSRLIEIPGAPGLLALLLLVAYEVRQNTHAARAAAIQQTGIPTVELRGEFDRDARMIRLMEKRSDMPGEEWTADAVKWWTGGRIPTSIAVIIVTG